MDNEVFRLRNDDSQSQGASCLSHFFLQHTDKLGFSRLSYLAQNTEAVSIYSPSSDSASSENCRGLLYPALGFIRCSGSEI